MSISLAARVRLLGVTAVLAIGCVAAVYSMRDASLAAIQAEQNSYVSRELDASHLMHGVLNLRKNEKDFALGRSLLPAEAFREGVNEVQAGIDALRGHNSQDRRAALEAVDEALGAYTAAFEAIVRYRQTLGISQDEGLEGSLRAAVRSAEQRLAEFEDDALTVKMLMMRRHEKDFMLRVSSRYVDRLDARVSEFETLWRTRDHDQRVLDEVSALVRTYQQDFHAWAQMRLELETALIEVETGYEALTGAVYALEQAAEEASALAAANTQAMRDQSQRVLWFWLCSVTLLTALVSWFMARLISHPVKRLASLMRAIAAGDQGQPIPFVSQNNELGEMSRALSVFRDNAKETTLLRSEQDAERARSVQQTEQARMTFLNELESTVGSLINTVASSATKLTSASEKMQAESRLAGSEASTARETAEETSSITQSLAEATEALSASIEQIRHQAMEAKVRGDETVEQTRLNRSTIAELTVAVEEVGEVVELIRTVAEQTNLLALNATIEAARAGEAGKGFAVVASEVKELADQTSKNTVVIDERIQSIRSSAERVVSSMERVSEQITRTSTVTGGIAASISEQQQATVTIAMNVAQVAERSADVAGAVTRLRQSVDATDQSAAGVNEDASNLATQAAALRSDLNAFFERLRAA